MSIMNEIDIRKIDLNLLMTLHVLLEECNVSRAAARLSLSQSAVSHALSRLREHLSDPLFVRKSHGMVPTPRALEISGPLRQVLSGIDQIIGPSTFDPSTAVGTIRIVSADYGIAILVPKILHRLKQEAPSLNLECHDWSEHTLDHLKTGIVDLVFGGQEMFEGYRVETLFTEKFVSVVRKGHPLSRKGIELNDYLHHQHALVEIYESRMRRIDKELERMGLNRRIVVKFPQFLAAPFIIEENDMIVTLPERLAKLFSRLTGLVILEPPVDIGVFPYVQVWHERRDNDPLHGWFRSLVREQCTGI